MPLPYPQNVIDYYAKLGRPLGPRDAEKANNTPLKFRP